MREGLNDALVIQHHSDVNYRTSTNFAICFDNASGRDKHTFFQKHTRRNR